MGRMAAPAYQAIGGTGLMAVYTHLSENDVTRFLQDYSCGHLQSFVGIAQGVENTNYIITTDRDKYILTIFEARTNPADLPFFFAYMEHLKREGINCPVVIDNKIGKIKGKAAVLISFLDGANIKSPEISPNLCFQMGEFLARMHVASASFTLNRPNSMSLPTWQALFNRFTFRADQVSEGLHGVIKDELSRARNTLALDLPCGVVHADAFPDNVFQRNGKISGIIDFYFSATDFFVYDLAITLNAWCFEKGVLKSNNARAMIEGYESVRKLTDKEKDAFSDIAGIAALRILMTRTHDFIFHDPANLVHPKDPVEYRMILEHHKHDKILG